MANYGNTGIGNMLNSFVSSITQTGGSTSQVNAGANNGVAQTGYQFTTFSSIALGSNPVPISNSNLKFPNNYPLSNLQLTIVVTDTTGGSSAPSGVNSIESAISQLQIIGSSGKPIFIANGSFGELTRWQQILNDNQAYTAAPTPADTSTSTAYPVTWLLSLKHLVIDPSEAPLTVQVLPNTLASRATTLNAMTSSITSITVAANFVPTTGYVKTLYRTKQLADASTGYFDVGNYLDNAMLSAVGLDFGTDAKLSSNNTFYLSDNNNTLIPYTSYNSIVLIQNALPANSGGAANHISGFFPMMTLYNAAINGNDNIHLTCNVASAPSGGGQANTINLYQSEQYA